MWIWWLQAILPKLSGLYFFNFCALFQLSFFLRRSSWVPEPRFPVILLWIVLCRVCVSAVCKNVVRPPKLCVVHRITKFMLELTASAAWLECLVWNGTWGGRERWSDCFNNPRKSGVEGQFFKSKKSLKFVMTSKLSRLDTVKSCITVEVWGHF